MLRINQLSPLSPLKSSSRWISGQCWVLSLLLLQEAVQSSRKAFISFLAGKKAFDTVWHKGVLVKIHQRGITGYVWQIIKNWYCSSYNSVLWGGQDGGILSCFVYSIFVEELLEHFSSFWMWCITTSTVGSIYAHAYAGNGGRYCLQTSWW